MNSLVETGYLSEMKCGTNFAYTLSDNGMFQATEYKVLQSQAKGGFVRCMKMLYNGKTQLYYITGGNKPFSSMIQSLDADGYITVFANMLSGIIAVKNNGFLSCQNLDISFEHIYIDPMTLQVYFVYLPLYRHAYAEYSYFENEFRASLVKLISSMGNSVSPKILQFSADLSNGMFKLEDLMVRLKGGRPSGGASKAQNAVSGRDSVMRIIAMNAPSRIEITVNKDEFILGKKSDSVDGVISFNKMISRIHCKINKINGQYTITDLQSSNGTYVNKARLQPNQPRQLKNGDIIRLANSDFQVSIV